MAVSRIVQAFTVLLVAGLMACASPAQHTRSRSRSRSPGARILTKDDINAIQTAFPVTVVAPTTRAFMPIAAAIEDDNAIERMGRLTSILIDFRDLEVPMVVEECGEPTAYYQKNKRRIRICYEFIELAAQLANSPTDTFNDDLFFVIEFVVLHEIAHALIHLLGLHIDDGEGEMRADQFATLVLTISDDARLVHVVMHAFTKFFVEVSELESDDGIHARGKDRATDAICLVWWRSRPALLASSMKGEVGRTCDAYAAEAFETWNTWLAPSTRLETGQTFRRERR